MWEAGADLPAGTSSIAATPPDVGTAAAGPPPRLGHEKPLALSGQRLEADHRHHSQQIPAAESRTHRWAWCLADGVWP
jgi:hypothetical protein